MAALTVEVLVRQAAWLLLGATAVGLVTRWLRIPYAVALVLAGAAAGAVAHTWQLEVPHLEPAILLFAFLPPLLFDAAFRLDEREVHVVFPPILLLAIPGVIVTAAVVGVLVALPLKLPLVVGLLFGSIVAATDPVAVTAVFRRLNVHHRLGTIVEAESLVNDGTAITLYTALLAAASSAGLASGAAGGPAGGVGPAVAQALGTFAWQVVVGAGTGAIAGLVFSHLTATIDDHLVEMTLSTALAYGSYLVADSLHASGALACVAAGFIHGSYGRRIGMSQNTRELLDSLWEYFGFLANGLLFLLVGLTLDLRALWQAGGEVLLAVLAVSVARLLVVELSTRLIPAERSFAGAAGRGLLAWGGLRGALTLALAFALPAALPGRDQVVAMAVGVVAFTLVVQGSTLPLVVRWTGLAQPDPPD